jgi:hypothetical protein
MATTLLMQQKISQGQGQVTTELRGRVCSFTPLIHGKLCLGLRAGHRLNLWFWRVNPDPGFPRLNLCFWRVHGLDRGGWAGRRCGLCGRLRR